MKRFALTLVLACALSGTAMAGDVPSTGIVAAPPAIDETATPGDVPSTGSTAPGDMPTVDLSILLTVLSLVF